MMQADIYAAGFLAQKNGADVYDNPYPITDQPSHATWWNGWHYGEMARAIYQIIELDEL